MTGECLACAGQLYQGTNRHLADDYICRQCQRKPSVQVRVHLARGRTNGMAFDTAYDWALSRVRWPHDKTARLEWKAHFKKDDIVELYRAGFLREQVGRRPITASSLELVA